MFYPFLLLFGITSALAGALLGAIAAGGMKAQRRGDHPKAARILGIGGLAIVMASVIVALECGADPREAWKVLILPHTLLAGVMTFYGLSLRLRPGAQKMSNDMQN